MNAMVKLLAGAALVWAALSIEARAGDCIWGGVTAGSHHFDSARPKDYEQQNWGPHFEACLGREDLRAFSGWDRNSKRRDSVYFGSAYSPIEVGPVRIGIALARVSGYSEAKVKEERQADGTVKRTVEIDDEALWAVFPVLAIEGRRLGANLMYFPKTKNNVAVLAWQFKWRFR